MDDTDGALNFDFEGGIEAAAGPTNPANTPGYLIHSASAAGVGPAPNNPLTASAASSDLYIAGANPAGRRSFRQTVCRHWLRSLCMKGDACGFLHQYDKSRMPVCRFFRLYGECREQDCVYKHTNEDIKECNMYKLGFCPNGPDCRYRHAKLPGPPPAVEEVLHKIQHLNSYNYNPNKFFQHRNTSALQEAEKSQVVQISNAVSHGVAGKPSNAESDNIQQQQRGQQSHLEVGQNQIQSASNGLPNQVNRTAKPLPQGISRCVQSPEKEENRR